MLNSSVFSEKAVKSSFWWFWGGPEGPMLKPQYSYRNIDGLRGAEPAQITSKHENTKNPLKLMEMSGNLPEFAEFGEIS